MLPLTPRPIRIGSATGYCRRRCGGYGPPEPLLLHSRSFILVGIRISCNIFVDGHRTFPHTPCDVSSIHVRHPHSTLAAPELALSILIFLASACSFHSTIKAVERETNYAKLDWYMVAHHRRFRRFVESRKLTCQDCGGAGGYKEPILDDGTGPWFECGWCEGTGYITPHGRGVWLRFKRDDARSNKK
jgi:hypothetical protein